MSKSTKTVAFSSPRFLSLFMLYVCVSFALGILSLELAANREGVSVIWLPAGSALVALVFIDMRLWPSIALASLASNLYFGSNIQTAFGIGIGSALGAVIATLALRNLGSWNSLSIFYRALKLGTIGAAISAVISAGFGVTSLYLSGILPSSDWVTVWARWVMGDSVGIFLFSSFILIYYMVDDRETKMPKPN